MALAPIFTTPVPAGRAMSGLDLDALGLVAAAILADFQGADVLGLVTASPAANTVLGRLKAVADLLAVIDAHVDGLEALTTAMSSKLPAALGPQTSANSLSIAPASNAIFPVVPQLASGGNIAAQTAGAGLNYAAFANQACKQLTIVNNTGTKLEFRQGAGGIAVPIFDQAAFTIFGITNANQIDIRRADQSNTQVTAQARWEA